MKIFQTQLSLQIFIITIKLIQIVSKKKLLKNKFTRNEK